MDWQEQLISLYLTVSNAYEKDLRGYIVRLANHVDMSFSDEEVMTIYIFGILNGRSNVKAIYEDTVRHYHAWFPTLLSYVGFVQRLNKISHLFEGLTDVLMGKLPASFRRGLF